MIYLLDRSGSALAFTSRSTSPLPVLRLPAGVARATPPPAQPKPRCPRHPGAKPGPDPRRSRS